jgi:hypothetical protein
MRPLRKSNTRNGAQAGRVHRGLAVGWLNWGFYDQPEATDVSQLTGLLTTDRKMKAWGREFKTLAAHYAGRKIPALKLGVRPALDWDSCITSAAKERSFAKPISRRGRQAAESCHMLRRSARKNSIRARAHLSFCVVSQPRSGDRP